MSEEVAFVDGVVAGIRETLIQGADSLHESVQELLPYAVSVTIRTPYPRPEAGFFFGTPENEPWTSMYSYYTELILPVTVLLLALAIAMILFTGIFGTFLSGYERSRAKRRLFVAFLFVLAWWGIGSFTLRFADALATSIAPEADAVADTLSLHMTLDSGGTVTDALLASLEAGFVIGMMVWYLLRWIGIYALMLAMPIATALWIVDVGPLGYLSAIIEDLAVMFIPLAFITVPAAVIFRVADLLLANIDPVVEFGTSTAAYLLVLCFPMLTIVVSYFVFFKMPSIRTVIRRGYADGAPEAVSSREEIEKGRAEAEPRESASEVYKRPDESPERGGVEGRSLDVERGRATRQRPTRTYGATPSATDSGTSKLQMSRDKIHEIQERR